MANLHDAPYLTMLILNKITGEARKHIQDKSELKLEDVLKTLERIYSHEEDVSQMLQALSNIQKNHEESIQEYGGRVNQLLNKLISQVMENTSREKGIGQCEAYKEIVIGNFLRGLDLNTYMAIHDKDIKSVDDAIALASKADQKIKSWGGVHGSVSVSVPPVMSGSGLKNKFGIDQLKRVAHMQIGNDYKPKRDLGKIQCFDCKEFGHYKRNCPNKQNKIIKDKEGGQCSYCYRNNHVIGDCRIKIRHEKERSKYSPKLKCSNLNFVPGCLVGGQTTQNESPSQVRESSSRSENLMS